MSLREEFPHWREAERFRLRKFFSLFIKILFIVLTDFGGNIQLSEAEEK